MKKIFIPIAVLFLFVCSVSLFACKEKEQKRTKYEITCSLDENYLLTGVEKVIFYNDKDNSFTSLKFNIFANAFREGAEFSPVSAQYYHSAYPNGLNYGKVEITGCKGEENSLDYSICGKDENVLEVYLEKEIFPEEMVEVEIEYKISLANVIARTGYNEKTINLANFYPILCGIDQNGFYECVYYANGDPYFSECADYEVTFCASSEYVVASSGEIISAKEENGKTTATYLLKNARSFCFVFSKEFKCITDNSSGVTLNYYYYNDETPISSIEYALKGLETFSGLFGDFPYNNYSVVQTKFIQGGMEFPALVMISDELDPLSYGEVIVHETAHQWWQTAVGNNEIEYGFLDEGLAEYSTVLFYENRPEFSYTREKLIKSSEQTYKLYCSVYDKLFGGTDTSMLRAIPEFTSEYEYVNIAYVKSCIMYDQLRNGIGDEKFFSALKRYYSEFSFKNAVPDDLVACFIKEGADAEGFFNSFFTGKAII